MKVDVTTIRMESLMAGKLNVMMDKYISMI
jgi:hypothetical protein